MHLLSRLLLLLHELVDDGTAFGNERETRLRDRNMLFSLDADPERSPQRGHAKALLLSLVELATIEVLHSSGLGDHRFQGHTHLALFHSHGLVCLAVVDCLLLESPAEG